MKIHERSFHTGEISINLAEIPRPGTPTVVLLHGGSARWQFLKDAMYDLATNYQVIAPDLRGHGRSDNTPNAYRLSNFADDIQCLLESLEQPVALFGHSHGGNVALMVGARAPTSVRALVLGDAPFTPGTMKSAFKKQQAMLRQWVRLAGKPKEAILPLLKAATVQVGDEAERPAVEVLGESSPWFGDMADCLAHHDPAFLSMLVDNPSELHSGFVTESLLDAIQCPTLLLQADERYGGLMTDELVQLGLSRLRNGSHVELPGIGHALFVEDRDRVLDFVRKFLANVGL